MMLKLCSFKRCNSYVLLTSQLIATSYKMLHILLPLQFWYVFEKAAAERQRTHLMRGTTKPTYATHHVSCSLVRMLPAEHFCLKDMAIWMRCFIINNRCVIYFVYVTAMLCVFIAAFSIPQGRVFDHLAISTFKMSSLLLTCDNKLVKRNSFHASTANIQTLLSRSARILNRCYTPQIVDCVRNVFDAFLQQQLANKRLRGC